MPKKHELREDMIEKAKEYCESIDVKLDGITYGQIGPYFIEDGEVYIIDNEEINNAEEAEIETTR